MPMELETFPVPKYEGGNELMKKKILALALAAIMIAALAAGGPGSGSKGYV